MTDDGLTLNVEDRPTIEPGDELLIFPDVGRAYTVEVLAVEPDADRVKVRYPPDASGPRPVPSRTGYLPRDALEAWVINADLLINPDDPPHAYGEPEPAPDGGRYGPYESRADVARRDGRIARERSARRL